MRRESPRRRGLRLQPGGFGCGATKPGTTLRSQRNAASVSVATDKSVSHPRLERIGQIVAIARVGFSDADGFLSGLSATLPLPDYGNFFGPRLACIKASGGRVTPSKIIKGSLS